MRQIMLVVLLGGVAFGQTMADGSAAAAGGSAGGIGGKKVSDGISSIFDKAGRSAGKSVPAATAPAKHVKGVPPVQTVTTHVDESVPPPPPLVVRHAALHKQIAPATARIPEPFAPPPSEPAAADLRSVMMGMNRALVLSLGEPASRMMTADEGHLTEIYRYAAGVLHLTDGAVSSIDLQK